MAIAQERGRVALRTVVFGGVLQAHLARLAGSPPLDAAALLGGRPTRARSAGQPAAWSLLNMSATHLHEPSACRR